MKMQIFRVECVETGYGPYKMSNPFEIPKDQRSEVLDRTRALSYDVRPPPSFDDGIERFPSSFEFFGFESLNQLLSWFGPVLDDLESVGFHVLVYEIEDLHVVRGEYQVMFARDRANLLCSLTP